MMPKTSTFGFLPALPMPLRDALRGVASLADATKEILEPAARLLPEPVQSRFHQALASLEKAGKRMMNGPVDMGQIHLAAQVLTAAKTDVAALHSCATVFVQAWEHLDQASTGHRHLISETIVADRLTRTRAASDLSGAEFAAAVVIGIRKSSAIGLLPGLTRGMTAEDDSRIDAALLAIAVWLLSNRAESVPEEEKVLDLALALVRALQSELADPFGDAARLARFLSDTSAHL